MSQHTFDYAIVGAGLTGLSLAASLSRETKNIVLLDGAETFGGLTRPINFPTGMMDNGLRHIPATDLNEIALEHLESILGLKLMKSVIDAPPVTFEDGSLKPFVGFGDRSPEFYDQIAPLLNPRRFELHLEPREWPTLLMEKFTGQFMPRSHVTRVNVENDSVTHLTINGAKSIKASQVIYTGPVKPLAVILGDLLNARQKQKLSKNSYWTAVCLDLCHSKLVSEEISLHVLNGTTVDELGPCVGKFLPTAETADGVRQSSQWMTFLDEEVTEESEIVAHALKKIKRQIKRAYPEALDNLVRERILLAPMVSGNGDLKLNADQSYPGVQNLWIGSAALSKTKGTAAALLQSRLLLASLGFAQVPQILTEEILEANA